jgi:hypothetical protein
VVWDLHFGALELFGDWLLVIGIPILPFAMLTVTPWYDSAGI